MSSRTPKANQDKYWLYSRIGTESYKRCRRYIDKEGHSFKSSPNWFIASGRHQTNTSSLAARFNARTNQRGKIGLLCSLLMETRTSAWVRTYGQSWTTLFVEFYRQIHGLFLLRTDQCNSLKNRLPLIYGQKLETDNQ